MGDGMPKHKHGGKRGGGDRKGGRIGFLLRFHSDQQKAELERLAADDGVSLSKFLLGLSDRALAEKRERDAKTARIVATEQDLEAKEREIITLLGEMSEFAANHRRDHLVILQQATGWNIERDEGDDINPDPNSTRGRLQLAREFARIRQYFIEHHDPNILARPLVATLLVELLKLEDRLSLERRHGPDERERRWADRNAHVKPEFQDDDDDADDDDDDGGGGGDDYYDEDPDDDGHGDPGDDRDGDDFLA